jgi:hypothetical protein
VRPGVFPRLETGATYIQSTIYATVIVDIIRYGLNMLAYFSNSTGIGKRKPGTYQKNIDSRDWRTKPTQSDDHAGISDLEAERLTEGRDLSHSMISGSRWCG